MRTVLIWAVTALATVSATTSSNTGYTAKKISVDGCCGGKKGYTCQGSVFGNCCSAKGFCGKTAAHCNTGCNSAFGTCSRATVKTPTVGKVSTNSRCGYQYGALGGYTCKGSTFGNCCSRYGHCGSSKDYCGSGCQPGFGKCGTATPSSAHVSSKPSTSTRCSSTTKSNTLFPYSASKVAPSSVRPSSTKVSSATKPCTTLSTRASSSAVVSVAGYAVKSSSVASAVVTSSAAGYVVKSTGGASASSVVSSAVSSVVSAVSSDISSSAVSSDISSSAVPSAISSDISSAVSSDISSVVSSDISTSVPASTSSSVASSTVDSSSTASSVISSTITASATPCFAAPVNYVGNGGFENGVLSPWVNRIPSDTSIGVFQDASVAHSDQWVLRVTQDQSPGSSSSIIGQDVTIPAGTTVSFNYWIQYLGVSPIIMALWLDDNLIARDVVPGGQSWTRIGTQSPIVVQDGANGATHTLNMGIIMMDSVPSAGSAPVYIDDMLVVAVSGPGALPVCAAASPSSSAVSASVTSASSTAASESASASASESASASASESASASASESAIASASASASASATPTPVTPVCPAATNYLSNPDLETGFSSWVPTESPVATFGGTLSTQAAHSRNYGFVVYGLRPTPGSVHMIQRGIAIPDGQSVRFSAWLGSFAPSNVISMSLFIDGALAGSYEATTNDWVQVIANPFTVSGDTHTAEIVVYSTGSAGTAANPTYYFDDFAIVPDCTFSQGGTPQQR